MAQAALTSEGVDWAGKPAELGYYDQAHLIRDFTRTIGVAPATYASTHRRRAAAEPDRRPGQS